MPGDARPAGQRALSGGVEAVAITTEVVKVGSSAEALEAAERGAEVLRQGGLVAFPTETVYGLAANVADSAAMERLRELKSRPDRPFTVHIGRPEQASWYVGELPRLAARLMQKAWPGPVTVVLPFDGFAREDWPARWAERVAYGGTVGLRCPAHPVAEAMLGAMETPVVAPSANVAGKAPPSRAEEVLAAFEGQIDLVIDAGATKWGRASTVVQFHADGSFEILREELYDRRIIERLLQHRILFVCTGNTCRSPMAAGIARAELARHLGCLPHELEAHGWQILSAGTMGLGGAPATDEAVQASLEVGADIGRHRSQPLSIELINSADMLFCMAEHHREQVLRMVPSAADRTFLLDARGDVPDPIGSGIEVYRQAARRIQDAFRARLSEMLP